MISNKTEIMNRLKTTLENANLPENIFKDMGETKNSFNHLKVSSIGPETGQPEIAGKVNNGLGVVV